MHSEANGAEPLLIEEEKRDLARQVEEEKRDQARQVEEEKKEQVRFEEEKQEQARQVKEGSTGSVNSPAPEYSSQRPEGPSESVKKSSLVISLEGSLPSLGASNSERQSNHERGESIQQHQMSSNSSQNLSDSVNISKIGKPEERQVQSVEVRNLSLLNRSNQDKSKRQQALVPQPVPLESRSAGSLNQDNSQGEEIKESPRGSIKHGIEARKRSQSLNQNNGQPDSSIAQQKRKLRLSAVEELSLEQSFESPIAKQEQDQNSSKENEQDWLFEESKEPKYKLEQGPKSMKKERPLRLFDLFCGPKTLNSDSNQSNAISKGSKESDQSFEMGSQVHSNLSRSQQKYQPLPNLAQSRQIKVSNHFQMMGSIRQVKTPAQSIKMSKKELQEQMQLARDSDPNGMSPVKPKIVQIAGFREMVVASDSECMSESDMFASDYEGIQSPDKKSISSSQSLGQKSIRSQISEKLNKSRKSAKVAEPQAQENQPNQTIKSIQDYLREDSDGPATWTLQRQVQQQDQFDAVRGGQSNRTINSHIGLYKGKRMIRHLREKLKQIDQRFSA